MQLETNISIVYQSDGKALVDANGKVSLFDRLLGGGLVIPDVVVNSWLNEPTSCSPIILLISGPAGTGKTTLAMELVYRLSSQGIKQPSNGTVHKFPSVYISSESQGNLLVESKVADLGWNSTCFVDESNFEISSTSFNGVLVVGKDATPFVNMQNPGAFFKHLAGYCEYQQLVKKLGSRPGVLVLDSLNILPPSDRGKHFLDLINKLRGPFLMVVILDTHSEDIGDPFWGFAADAIIHLTQSECEDPRVGTYLLGEFRVVKARWQKHALGPHQMKIFGKIDPNSVHSPPNRTNYHGTGHLPPFRKDGGIQLYQSVHRHLSEGQKLVRGWEGGSVAAPEIQFDSSSLNELDKIIGGGFPKGRCTAIVGDRGSLKSHLAYLWLLSSIAKSKEPGLLLTLRDDEGEALSRLTAISDSEVTLLPSKNDSPAVLIERNLLRVVHFRPGYIAPDEFLFRLWFHVNDFKPTRVVIASLEQLDTLFPLCSVEPVFVPSILDILAASGITAVAVGVSGGHQPPTQYGLLPQSSLILSFTSELGPEPGYIRLKVSRLPTALPSGRGGWIYLDNLRNELQFTTKESA